MRLFLLALILLALPSTAVAEIIFQENFDAAPDWSSNETAAASPDYPGTQAAPAGFTGYREGRSMWTGAPKHHVISAGASAEGGTGKGLTYNVESAGNATYTGGGFGKYLGWPGHQRLFLRWSMKNPSNFCWQAPDSTDSGQGKLARITATRRPLTDATSPFNPAMYKAPGNADNAPTFYPDWYPRLQYNNGVRTSYAPNPILITGTRLAPGYTTGPSKQFPTALFPSDKDAGAVLTASPTAPIVAGQGYCGDGKWHQYEVEVWMNSALGVADGGYNIYLDGALWGSASNIAWVNPGSDVNGTVMTLDSGWNFIWIPDNHELFPYPLAQQVAMPMYLDNIIAYTPITSADPLWASSPQDGRLPLNYTIGTPVDPDVTAPVTTATPAAGSYSIAQTVTLSTEPGATIYYTTDGSTPTTSSAVYSAPLTVSSTTTLKYFARDGAGNNEIMNIATYTINSPAPLLTSTERIRGDLRGSLR